MKKFIILFFIFWSFLLFKYGYCQTTSGTNITNGTTRQTSSIAKVLVFSGDSITNAGGGTTFSGLGDWYGWRKNLQMILNNYYSMTFFGQYNSPPSSQSTYPNFQSPLPIPGYSTVNDGFPGNTTAQIATRMETQTGPLLSTSATNQIVTILAGTNDVLGGLNLTTAVSNVMGEVSYLQNYNANIDVYVMTITPLTNYNGGSVDANRIAYNNALRAAVQSAQGSNSHLNLIDLEAVMTNTSLCPTLPSCQISDGIHPNDLGFTIIGSVIANCILNHSSQYCDGH